MDLKFWTKALKEAERELDAACPRTAMDAAAKKLMRAKEALKRLQVPARRATEETDLPPLTSGELMTARKSDGSVALSIHRDSNL